MQSQRETQTDSLASIIQILQIGVRSGMLTVERGEGPTLEEGYLVFVNGRVVDARTRQHTSWAAFNYLKAWGSCRFSFESGVSSLSNIHTSGNGNGGSPVNGAAYPGSVGYMAHSSSVQQDGAAARWPVRTQGGEAALLNPDPTTLPRAHRRLLLLINGQRSQDDLARLISRTSDEVRVLLDALEQAGLILK